MKPTHRVHFSNGRTLDTCNLERYDEPDQRYYISRSGTRQCSDDNRIHIPYENVNYVEEIL